MKQGVFSVSKAAKKGAAKTKYRILSDALLKEIEEGKWQSGDRLPSEEKLVSTLGYSLGTVQRALRYLADMGVVDRVHGSGTFVAGAQAPTEQLRHFRFFDEDGATLLPTFFKTLSIVHSEVEGPWSELLGRDCGGYINIKRLISVNREFEIFSELYLPANKFAVLLEMDLADLDGVSVRDLLVSRFNMHTLKAKQTIMCGVFPPRVGREIKVPMGQFGIILTVGSTTHQDVPIVWQRAFIPPNDRQMDFLTTIHA